MIFPRYTAMDIAKFIITICTSCNSAINEIMLNKILWYIQLSFISTFDYPAFTDDIVAGFYGPEVKNIHDSYSTFGSTKICFIYDNVDIFSEEEEKVILLVVQKCLKYHQWDLVRQSQQELWQSYYTLNQQNVIPLTDITIYAKQ